MTITRIRFTESDAAAELEVERHHAVLRLSVLDSNGVETWTTAALNRDDIERLHEALGVAISRLDGALVLRPARAGSRV